ncbi:MAG TPA: hypothetical protein VHV10_20630 [Ktedonobacteraceae bacterium]|jgi:DNA-binding transcriptional MerR regulator|nr:hypothetical protein [Ktedonobacteraceae bacterium]
MQPTEESELSPKQHQLIAALVAGNSIVDAAKAVGVAERTAHLWLKQPLFSQIYRDTERSEFEDSLEETRESKRLIREMLLKHIEARVDVTPASQLQAAKLLLEQYVVADEIAQLKQQISELQIKIETLETGP